MLGDFVVCPDGAPCRRQVDGGELPGSASAGIVQRLEELMRRCREDGHRPTYQDLLEIRTGGHRG